MAFSRIALLLGILVPALSAQQDEVRVASATSGWLRGGKTAVSRGDALPFGEQLTRKGAGDIFLHCPNGPAFVYSCRQKGQEECQINACQPHATFGRAVNLPSRFSIDQFFRRQPREPVTAAARAGGNPSDAVLAQDGRGIRFGGALRRVLEGRYCLTLDPLPLMPGAERTVFLDWDRAVDPEGVAPAANLPPGLYELEKGTPSAGNACMADPDGTAAWVLVTASTDFTQLNTDWERQSSSIEELERAGVANQTLVAVRRAVLAALASSVEAR